MCSWLIKLELSNITNTTALPMWREAWFGGPELSINPAHDRIWQCFVNCTQAHDLTNWESRSTKYCAQSWWGGLLIDSITSVEAHVSRTLVIPYPYAFKWQGHGIFWVLLVAGQSLWHLLTCRCEVWASSLELVLERLIQTTCYVATEWTQMRFRPWIYI